MFFPILSHRNVSFSGTSLRPATLLNSKLARERFLRFGMRTLTGILSITGALFVAIELTMACTCLHSIGLEVNCSNIKCKCSRNEWIVVELKVEF